MERLMDTTNKGHGKEWLGIFGESSNQQPAQLEMQMDDNIELSHICQAKHLNKHQKGNQHCSKTYLLLCHS